MDPSAILSFHSQNGSLLQWVANSEIVWVHGSSAAEILSPLLLFRAKRGISPLSTHTKNERMLASLGMTKVNFILDKIVIC
jgi:hypothetical protein